MPTIDQLSKLFKALAHKDLDAAEQLAAAIAADEERKGHGTAAQVLKGSLTTNGARSVVEQQMPAPKNGMAVLLTGALSQRIGCVRLGDVVLRPEARRVVEELVREFAGQAQLKSLGIRRRSKLLFHGPPGCGKTLTAQALANELQLPLYVSDSMPSSVRTSDRPPPICGSCSSLLTRRSAFSSSTRSTRLGNVAGAQVTSGNWIAL